MRPRGWRTCRAPRWPPAPSGARGAFRRPGRWPPRTRPQRRTVTPRPWSPRTGRPASAAATWSLFSIRGLEPKADAPHRVNQVHLGRALQFAPEIADVHIDHIALRIEVQVPDFFEQIRAADDLFRTKQEVLE